MTAASVTFVPVSRGFGGIFDAAAKKSQLDSHREADRRSRVLEQLREKPIGLAGAQAPRAGDRVRERAFTSASPTWKRSSSLPQRARASKTRFAAELKSLEERADQIETEALLSAEHDHSNAIVVLHSGAGGTESQDWTEMLLRMYVRWAERKGVKTELTDSLPGEEAGLKSATFTVAGDNAYGLMRSEIGVHRLVRISPFDSAARAAYFVCIGVRLPGDR